MPVAAQELDGVLVRVGVVLADDLFGMVLAGTVGEHEGPLAPLTTGITAFAAGLLLSGTAGTMWLFLLGRAVQGLGGGLVVVALYVVVVRAYPERLRPAIMAAFAASWVIPFRGRTVGRHGHRPSVRWVFTGIPVLVVFPLALALSRIRRLWAGRSADGGTAARALRAAAHPGWRWISLGSGLLQYAAQDLALPRPWPRGRRAARPGRPRAAAARHLPGGARAAARGAAARAGRRCLRRRPSPLCPHAGHPARAVAERLAGFSLAAAGGTWRWGRMCSRGHARSRTGTG